MVEMVEANGDSYEAVEYGWDGPDFVTVDTKGKTRRYRNATVNRDSEHPPAKVEVKDGKVHCEFTFYLPPPKPQNGAR